MERTRLELLFDQELLQNAEQARILCGSPVTRFVRSVQSRANMARSLPTTRSTPALRCF